MPLFTVPMKSNRSDNEKDHRSSPNLRRLGTAHLDNSSGFRNKKSVIQLLRFRVARQPDFPAPQRCQVWQGEYYL